MEREDRRGTLCSGAASRFAVLGGEEFEVKGLIVFGIVVGVLIRIAGLELWARMDTTAGSER